MTMYNHEPENYTCPFCKLRDAGIHNDLDIVCETESTIAFMSFHNQENSGPTVLVSPKAHIENLYDMSDAVLTDVMIQAKKIALAMKSCWPIDGTTLWQHNEPGGSQDVWHFHLHVKARFDDDEMYRARKVFTAPETRHAWANDLRNFMSQTHLKTHNPIEKSALRA